MRKALLAFVLLFAPTMKVIAEEKPIYLFIFEMEITTLTGTEGPVLVRLGEGHPAKLTSPAGRIVAIAMKQTLREDRVLTEITSGVRLNGSDLRVLPLGGLAT